MPIARSSVLWAHVLTSLVANLISVVVVVLVALLAHRTGAGVLAWLAVLGILMLFTLALTWIAVIPGLTAKSVDGASAFSLPLIFLPFISSAFVPTETMPGPVRYFAEYQPVTIIVNSIRDLFTQQPVGTDIWIAWPGVSASSASRMPSRWPPSDGRSHSTRRRHGLCRVSSAMGEELLLAHLGQQVRGVTVALLGQTPQFLHCPVHRRPRPVRRRRPCCLPRPVAATRPGPPARPPARPVGLPRRCRRRPPVPEARSARPRS